MIYCICCIAYMVSIDVPDAFCGGGRINKLTRFMTSLIIFFTLYDYQGNLLQGGDIKKLKTET